MMMVLMVSYPLQHYKHSQLTQLYTDTKSIGKTHIIEYNYTNCIKDCLEAAKM